MDRNNGTHLIVNRHLKLYQLKTFIILRNIPYIYREKIIPFTEPFKGHDDTGRPEHYV